MIKDTIQAADKEAGHLVEERHMALIAGEAQNLLVMDIATVHWFSTTQRASILGLKTDLRRYPNPQSRLLLMQIA